MTDLASPFFQKSLISLPARCQEPTLTHDRDHYLHTSSGYIHDSLGLSTYWSEALHGLPNGGLENRPCEWLSSRTPELRPSYINLYPPPPIPYESQQPTFIQIGQNHSPHTYGYHLPAPPLPAPPLQIPGLQSHGAPNHNNGFEGGSNGEPRRLEPQSPYARQPPMVAMSHVDAVERTNVHDFLCANNCSGNFM